VELRRSFATYGAAWLAIALIADALPTPFFSVLTYPFGQLIGALLVVLLAAGSAWLIAPRNERGWWVVRYGLAVLMAHLLVLLVMTVFPILDPMFYDLRREPQPFLLVVGLWALFFAILWVCWKVIRAPTRDH
jgi:hypothetical protein